MINLSQISSQLKSKAYYFRYNNSIDKILEKSNQQRPDQAPILHLKNNKQISDFLALPPSGDHISHTIAVVGAAGNHRQAASIMKYPDGHSSILALDTLDGNSKNIIKRGIVQNSLNGWGRATQLDGRSKTKIVHLNTQKGLWTCSDHSVSMAKAMRKHDQSLRNMHQGFEEQQDRVSAEDDKFLYGKAKPEFMAKLLVHSEDFATLRSKAAKHQAADVPLGKTSRSISDILASKNTDGLSNTSIYEKRAKRLEHISWRQILLG